MISLIQRATTYSHRRPNVTKQGVRNVLCMRVFGSPLCQRTLIKCGYAREALPSLQEKHARPPRYGNFNQSCSCRWDSEATRQSVWILKVLWDTYFPCTMLQTVPGLWRTAHSKPQRPMTSEVSHVWGKYRQRRMTGWQDSVFCPDPDSDSTHSLRTKLLRTLFAPVLPNWSVKSIHGQNLRIYSLLKASTNTSWRQHLKHDVAYWSKMSAEVVGFLL